MTKLIINKQPYHECPSFDRCSANKCPLDPDIDLRDSAPGDRKCKGEKPTRIKIGSKYPELLPYKGLTKREYQGLQRWNSLSTAERGVQLQRLSKRIKVAKPLLAV